MNDSSSLSQDSPCPTHAHTTRPASPFFRHRPLGRAPSPPTWACYEQIPARSDLLGSSESDSDSGDAADEDSLSDAESSSSSDDADDDNDIDADADADPDAKAETTGHMDVESDKDDDDHEVAAPALDLLHHPTAAAAATVTATAATTTTTAAVSGDPEKRDKGKQRAEDPPNSSGGISVPVAHPRSRRPRGRRHPVSVLRPILTIQRSQGFVWNQVRLLAPLLGTPILFSFPPSFYAHDKTSAGPLRSTIHKGPLYV